MQTIVGVLRGGPSREHEVSLQSGATILANLPEELYQARDIYIDKQGVWHDHGRPISPERILRQIDVALIGLHGEYGEDGQVQKLLERFGVPYAGADAYASYLALHKLMSKSRARDAGLLTPDYRYIEMLADSEFVAHEIIRKFHQPVVVKPVGWGSSLGVSLVGGYASVLGAIEDLFAQGAPGVLVEEYIRGKEATVGVVEDMRGEPLYALPAIEIESSDGGIFSFLSKYSGDLRETCPGNFSRVQTEELLRAAKVMHRSLGLRHYSRSDFIVAPRGVYYLETNSLPPLTDESLILKELTAVGVAIPAFFDHLVNLALGR